MNLPQNQAELGLSINTIIEVYEFNQGAIDPDKSLHFSIEETEKTFKVKFEFVIADIPSTHDDPQLDNSELEWDNDFFTMLKTESMQELIKYVHKVLEMVDGLTIRNEKQTDNDF